MAYDGIVTQKIASELINLSGARIDKVFEPDKNTIILGMYLNGYNYALNICIDSQNYGAYLTTHTKPNPKLAPNFCMLLRKYLLGMHIKNFITDNLERVIIIEFEGFDDVDDIVSLKLVIELMGKHSNILLLDEQNVIIDCLRHIYSDDSENIKTRNLFPKNKYVFPVTDKVSFLNVSNFEEFNSILQNNGLLLSDTESLTVDTLVKVLINSFNGFSKSFIFSVIDNLNITSISLDSLNKIYTYIHNIVYSEDTTKLDFRIIQKNGKKNNDYIICESIKDGEYSNNNYNNSYDYNNNYNSNYNSNCNSNYNSNYNSNVCELFHLNFFLDDFYFNKYSSEKFIGYRNSLLKLIFEVLKKYNKRLENMDDKLAECKNMDKYKLYGELITANLYRIENKNIDYVFVENYYDNNNLIKIDLDKKYSPSINAKRFYKKYNKLKNTLEIVSVQKEDTLKDLDYIESVVYELENSSSLEDLSSIYEEISENDIFKDKIPSSFDKKKDSKSKKLKKNNLTKNKNVTFNPIKYTIDGFTILVGRNNKENDYLTLKYASKNDIWFHTQDIHGSHVILKLNNSVPSLDILQKVASIAALHSKAKNSSNVPVDYCEVRYVKKPSNAKPGMVIYTHQHTLNVTPSGH